MGATRLVILEAKHSPRLADESYRPAVFSAFFARVRPDVVCREMAP